MRNPTRLSHQFIKTPTVVKVPTLDRVSIQTIIETIGKESLAIKLRRRRTINNMYRINEWMDKAAKAYRKLFKKSLRPTKIKQPTRKSNAVAKKPTRKKSK
jgi:hypothetical protein